jgi:2,7-dihydroxy-5-methyl-1-naphthoate 7-O-methyltransferase
VSEHGGADLEALSDLRTPWCVRVVVTLRIAEQLAAGSASVGDLAAAAGCDPIALERVLAHLAGKGVFTETPEGRFELNDAARELLAPTMRLGLDLDGIGGRLAYAWGTLPTYVRTGSPGYHELFGMGFWDDLAAHPEVGASFDALMGPEGHGPADPEILVKSDWHSVRTVVDVGGGTGAMLAEILRAHPGIEGTLVDLPGTVARSGETFAAAGVADRVSVVAQSFFDPLPAGADLYLLRKVINDWPDPQAVAILRRCTEAARPGGLVAVRGGVAPHDEARRLSEEAVLLGGGERTVSEFRELARAAGLEVVAAGSAPSGAFVVECRPA